METFIYQILSLLILVIAVKGWELYIKWKKEREFRKELPKLMESMKRRAEMEVKLDIMMFIAPILIAKAIKKKKEEEAKLKDESSKNCI